MPYVTWHPGLSIDEPVYLDANVLVGYVIRSHIHYGLCVQLLAELIAANAKLCFSLLTVQESLWAIARISYQTVNRAASPNFSQGIYNRWLDRMFEAHSPWFSAIGAVIDDWVQAGIPIEVVPKEETQLLQVLNLTPQYMIQHKLTPADATHLALAQTHAKTLVTADRDLARVADDGKFASLAAVHLTPS